nr:paired amphipathic helix protein Sin3-like 2 isoform X1 [Tanacetum cinerariifolium]
MVNGVTLPKEDGSKVEKDVKNTGIRDKAPAVGVVNDNVLPRSSTKLSGDTSRTLPVANRNFAKFKKQEGELSPNVYFDEADLAAYDADDDEDSKNVLEGGDDVSGSESTADECLREDHEDRDCWKFHYKDLLRACPHHGFSELHQLDTFYNALNPADQDSLNSAVDGNLLERHTQDVLMTIENKSKVRNSRNKSIVSQVKSSDASVKSVEEICVTCGGAHPYYQCLTVDGITFLEFQDNIQGYVSAAVGNYNH